MCHPNIACNDMDNDVSPNLRVSRSVSVISATRRRCAVVKRVRSLLHRGRRGAGEAATQLAQRTLLGLVGVRELHK